MLLCFGVAIVAVVAVEVSRASIVKAIVPRKQKWCANRRPLVEDKEQKKRKIGMLWIQKQAASTRKEKKRKIKPRE